MTIDNKIKDEKLPYNINREPVKISALLSGKIDKHEYLTAEEILPLVEVYAFSLRENFKNKQNYLRIKEKGG